MIDNRTAPYAALLLRVALGVMFLAHGLTKLLVYTLPGTAQFFAKIGFAGWLAYPVTIFEVAAGVLLILGVWPLGRRHRGGAAVRRVDRAFRQWLGFGNTGGGWEYPIFLTVVAAVLALLGDGKFALAGPARLSVRRGCARERRIRGGGGLAAVHPGSPPWSQAQLAPNGPL